MNNTAAIDHNCFIFWEPSIDNKKARDIQRTYRGEDYMKIRQDLTSEDALLYIRTCYRCYFFIKFIVALWSI